jgi:hypothetical protein
MPRAWVAAVACVVALSATACERPADDENVSADTTTVMGRDTVDGQSVPVTDTVIETTTTDTVQAKADEDSLKRDTIRN